jgi:hypothetical protein
MVQKHFLQVVTPFYLNPPSLTDFFLFHIPICSLCKTQAENHKTTPLNINAMHTTHYNYQESNEHRRANLKEAQRVKEVFNKPSLVDEFDHQRAWNSTRRVADQSGDVQVLKVRNNRGCRNSKSEKDRIDQSTL